MKSLYIIVQVIFLLVRKTLFNYVWKSKRIFRLAESEFGLEGSSVPRKKFFNLLPLTVGICCRETVGAFWWWSGRTAAGCLQAQYPMASSAPHPTCLVSTCEPATTNPGYRPSLEFTDSLLDIVILYLLPKTVKLVEIDCVHIV